MLLECGFLPALGQFVICRNLNTKCLTGTFMFLGYLSTQTPLVWFVRESNDLKIWPQSRNLEIWPQARDLNMCSLSRDL